MELTNEQHNELKNDLIEMNLDPDKPVWSLDKEKRFLDSKIEWFQMQGKKPAQIIDWLLAYQNGLKLRNTAFNGEGEMTWQERQSIMIYVDSVIELEGLTQNENRIK